MKPLKIKQGMGSAESIIFLIAFFFFFTFSLKFSLHSLHPLTWNAFHSSPMPSIWISNTNKSHLFGFVWAPPCCERKVGGREQRILELLSQNIDGHCMTLQPKTNVNVNVLRVTSLQPSYFYLFREKVDRALGRALFHHLPEFHTVTPGRWRTTHACCCYTQYTPIWSTGG